MTNIHEQMTASQTGLYVGDRIRIDGSYGCHAVCEVERFRDCLGVFITRDARAAGDFTPISSLYGFGSGSKKSYIANYGEFVENPVPLWSQVTRDHPLNGMDE